MKERDTNPLSCWSSVHEPRNRGLDTFSGTLPQPEKWAGRKLSHEGKQRRESPFWEQSPCMKHVKAEAGWHQKLGRSSETAQPETGILGLGSRKGMESMHNIQLTDLHSREKFPTNQSSQNTVDLWELNV